MLKKALQAQNIGFEMGKSDALRVKVYSSNTPAIEVSDITEKTKFAIGPYLFDLLWVVGWTYVNIGLIIVLPLALIIFLIFFLLNKLLKPRPSLWKFDTGSDYAVDKGDILYCSCQEGKRKNFIFCKNSKLENRSNFGNTLPFEFLYGLVFNSTILSL